MAAEIRLAFIWHMHQPDYRDPETGVHLLPWVRLHSLRGYTDIAKIAERYPWMRQTVNFSPVLLDQLTELTTHPSRDHFFELSRKPTEELSESDKDFLLRHCFLINWDVHVRPHPRFSRLLMKRGAEVAGMDLEYARAQFTRADYRDLVVLFNLAWCGFTLRCDPIISALMCKERGYTEEEKLILLEKHRQAVEEVIPQHAKLASKGILELTCTPENHPILPLLIDSHVRPDHHPDTPVFRHPEDARRQIKRGLARFESVFGFRPKGMWPSEGSVSQATVEMIQEAGLSWIAIDEALLLDPSTGTEVPDDADPGRPWLVGKPDGPPLAACFRNRGLSDDIGFNYANMDPEEAVEEFLGHLTKMVKSLDPNGPPVLLTLVCDGENPWEYYPDGGEGFLSGLAKALEADPCIRLTTPSQYLEEFPPSGRIEKLGAGSWIGGNFDIWMGCEEDRRAWKILADVRDVLDEEEPLAEGSEDEIGSETRRKVLEQLWVAEGSDWFWWFGEPFHSALDYLFDIIFRLRIRRAYQLLGLEPPVDVLVPVDPNHPLENINVEAPLDIISPEIDGRITTFYEWSGAGHLKASLLEGLMARSEPGPITDLYFNAGTSDLYLRLDIEREALEPRDVLLIRILKPIEINLAMELTETPSALMRCYQRADPRQRDCRIDTYDTAAVGQIVELAVPIKAIGASRRSTVSFACFLMRGMDQIDRCPLIGTVSVVVPDEKYMGGLWREDA